jgi:hypothetical protein
MVGRRQREPTGPCTCGLREPASQRIVTAVTAMRFLAAGALAATAVFADESWRGNEQIHQEIILAATTNASAAASGKAKLQAETLDGVGSANLDIEVTGLPAGQYTVSVTRKSDSKTFVLGLFALAGTRAGLDAHRGDGADDIEIRFRTETGVPLPQELHPLDVAGLFIADANGRVVLAGDFTDAAQMTRALFRARVAVTGNATGVVGTAQILTRTRRGFKTERFKLNVSGVTPNATLALKINGEDAGTVTTDARGRLRLDSLPEGIEPESIILMELADPAGTNALTISF